MSREFRHSLVVASRKHSLHQINLIDGGGWEIRRNEGGSSDKVFRFHNRYEATVECDRLNGIEIVKAMQRSNHQMRYAGDYSTIKDSGAIWRAMCEEALRD